VAAWLIPLVIGALFAGAVFVVASRFRQKPTPAASSVMPTERDNHPQQVTTKLNTGQESAIELLSSGGNKLQEVQVSSALTTPELVLLSKFQNPSPPHAYGANGFWEGALGEPPEKVIQRFISGGLIAEAPTETYVNSLSVKELRTQLKTLGMIVSGKREELVRRLGAVATPEMLTPPPDRRLWVVSPVGLEILNPYLQHKENDRRETVDSIQLALAANDLRKAADVATSFHDRWKLRSDKQRESMFPSHLSSKDLYTRLQLLKDAEKEAPECLRILSAEALKRLCGALTWAFALDENKNRSDRIRNLDLGLGVDQRWAAQMMTAWIQSKSSLESFRASARVGVKIKVQILTCDDCEISLRHKGKHYTLSSCPEIPLKGCVRKPCCGCCYTPVIEH
jgi:hypothetical protein